MDFIRSTYNGVTIYRYMLHRAMERFAPSFEGEILDLASGPSPSYHAFLPKRNLFHIHSSDVVTNGDRESVDFNKPLPWKSDYFDGLLFVNALYIVDDPHALLSEMKRVVKKDKPLVIISPFIANEMPDPHDYLRYTKEGLDRLFRESDLHTVTIERIGERGTSAIYVLHPFFKLWVLRALFYGLGLLVDRCIPRNARMKHPLPLGYFCIVMNTK